MSETTATTETQAPETDPTATAGPDVDLAAEVDKWKTHARKNEARAKENAAAAKRLAELEEAGKTEAERAAERIAKAETEAASVPAKVADGLRDALVSLGVVSEDRKVLLTASDPEALLAQVKAIQGLDMDRKRQGNHAPLQGRTPSKHAGDEDERAAARSLFGSGG